MNPLSVPELTVVEVARRRSDGGGPLILDVRETHEVAFVNLGPEVLLAPMSAIAARRLAALPPELDDRDREVVVVCHHGVRSLQVAAWLRQQGWRRVFNMRGGIDAYAQEIDPTLARY